MISRKYWFNLTYTNVHTMYSFNPAVLYSLKYIRYYVFFCRYKGAKRHSSTGDALELFRGNLQLQKRLRDLEAGNSTSSLGSNGNGKPAHRITDF